MFNCWVFGSANSVTRPDRDNQYNMRIVYLIHHMLHFCWLAGNNFVIIIFLLYYIVVLMLAARCRFVIINLVSFTLICTCVIYRLINAHLLFLTFSSEIRQIQCTRTEFWCVQCPRPAGLSALNRHQIQASALDLSYFTSKSKCKFINLIHTQQKNKIFAHVREKL